MYRLVYNYGSLVIQTNLRASDETPLWVDFFYLDRQWHYGRVAEHLGWNWLDGDAERYLREETSDPEEYRDLSEFFVSSLVAETEIQDRESFDPGDRPSEPRRLNRPENNAEENGDLPHVNCACATCKMARFEDSPLGPVVIEDYSYNPGWEMHGQGSYYLGVELETDSYKRSRIDRNIEVQSEFPISVAAAMRMPVDFWVPKSDSSVSGPEFCSHPATLDYWQSIRDEVQQMFTMLLHAGYRSHDNDTCGMHVNISRSAFDTPKHLYRFLTLLHREPDWALAMSQRTYSSMESWANLAYGDDTEKREGMAASYWDGEEIDHSTALNCPEEDRGNRFEFRLPRGTLRIDRFYKNLEWTVAMIEYTRHLVLSKATPEAFMEWARTRRDEYPDLVAYLDERFPVEVAA